MFSFLVSLFSVLFIIQYIIWNKPHGRSHRFRTYICYVHLINDFCYPSEISYLCQNFSIQNFWSDLQIPLFLFFLLISGSYNFLYFTQVINIMLQFVSDIEIMTRSFVYNIILINRLLGLQFLLFYSSPFACS